MESPCSEAETQRNFHNSIVWTIFQGLYDLNSCGCIIHSFIHSFIYLFIYLFNLFIWIFPQIMVLFCIKMIRKFIYQCKMQQGKELLSIEEGFGYI